MSGLQAATANKLMVEIPLIVANRWEGRERPVFLAYLGGRLSSEAKFELRANGISLKEFIQKNLSDKVRLFTVGETGDALVPVAETRGLTDAELASRHVSAPRHRPFPRFMGAVWRAFERPFSSDKRYLEMHEGRSAILHDLNMEQSPPPHSIEVFPSDLPPVDPWRGVAAPANVASSITAWAEKNNVDERVLYDLAHSAVLRTTPPTATSLQLAAPNISGAERLRNFLEILEPEDFARINIPSDVLLRILKQAS